MATGEEGEEVEFKVGSNFHHTTHHPKGRSKLYEWCSDAWTERGVGLLKVNFRAEKNATRLSKTASCLLILTSF